MIKEKISQAIQSALQDMGLHNKDISIEYPSNLQFGDYTTNIALQLAKELKKNPVALAEEIVEKISLKDVIENIEIVKPGFINFTLKTDHLLWNIQNIINGRNNIPSYSYGKQKKLLVEYAHPNTLKLFHIGHLRNIITGESIARLLEATGNQVIRVNYEGDVGMHIAKCLYQVKGQKSKVKSLNTIYEKIKFLGEAYAAGNKAFEEDPKVQEEIKEINKKIYEQHPDILPLWKETREWSLEYFDLIYKRVYTKFDRLYFESEFAQRGLELSKAALGKGILTKSDGAIVFEGKKYGLDTRVFVNSLGLPTYEGKELALAEKEISEYGNIDKIIHVVGPEQASFFKVTFKVEELIDSDRFKNTQYHLAYGWVKLKSGKMSSREGNVIEGEWLLDEGKKKIIENYKTEETTAETLAVAAVKYSFLKNSVSSTIAFDFDESISLEGNSGPYLLYTYARMRSILNKNSKFEIKNPKITEINIEERNILSKLLQYSDVVYNAAVNLSPHIVATYIYELTQLFNLFYQKHQILKADENSKRCRLMLTEAVTIILKEGLTLLGIETVEKI